VAAGPDVPEGRRYSHDSRDEGLQASGEGDSPSLGNEEAPQETSNSPEGRADSQVPENSRFSDQVQVAVGEENSLRGLAQAYEDEKNRIRELHSRMDELFLSYREENRCRDELVMLYQRENSRLHDELNVSFTENQRLRSEHSKLQAHVSKMTVERDAAIRKAEKNENALDEFGQIIADLDKDLKKRSAFDADLDDNQDQAPTIAPPLRGSSTSRKVSQKEF
jgi:regulator of replication initiation timing